MNPFRVGVVHPRRSGESERYMISTMAKKGFTRLSVALFTAALALNNSASAASTAEQLVKDTTDHVIMVLKEEREVIDKNPGRIYDIVNEFILPKFDFEKMSQRVLGKYWRTATPEQRSQFINEFQVLLVRTYATALREYSDQTIQFLPTRESAEEATVRTQIEQSGSPPIPINYELYLKDGDWKVFDIAIDGVSLVINYRSTFTSEIKKNGVDGLIARLAKHNSEKTE